MRGTSCIALGNLGGPVLADVKLREVLRVGYDQPLLVGQVQETDEAEAGGDVVHHALGVDLLQVVHDVGELERRVGVGRWRRAAILLWWRWLQLEVVLVSIRKPLQSFNTYLIKFLHVHALPK